MRFAVCYTILTVHFESAIPDVPGLTYCCGPEIQQHLGHRHWEPMKYQRSGMASLSKINELRSQPGGTYLRFEVSLK